MSRLVKDVTGAQVLQNPSSIEGSESSVESTSSISASQSEKMSDELVLPEISNDEVIISGIKESVDEIQKLLLSAQTSLSGAESNVEFSRRELDKTGFIGGILGTRAALRRDIENGLEYVGRRKDQLEKIEELLETSQASMKTLSEMFDLSEQLKNQGRVEEAEELRSAAIKHARELQDSLEDISRDYSETGRDYQRTLSSQGVENRKLLERFDKTITVMEVSNQAGMVALASAATIATGGVAGVAYGAAAGSGYAFANNGMQAGLHVSLGNKGTSEAWDDAKKDIVKDVKTSFITAASAGAGVGVGAAVRSMGAISRLGAGGGSIVAGASGGGAGGVTGTALGTTFTAGEAIREFQRTSGHLRGAERDQAWQEHVRNYGLDGKTLAREFAFSAGIGAISGGLGGGSGVLRQGAGSLRSTGLVTAELGTDVAIGVGSASMKAQLEGRSSPLTFEEIAQEVSSAIQGSIIGEAVTKVKPRQGNIPEDLSRKKETENMIAQDSLEYATQQEITEAYQSRLTESLRERGLTESEAEHTAKDQSETVRAFYDRSSDKIHATTPDTLVSKNVPRSVRVEQASRIVHELEHRNLERQAVKSGKDVSGDTTLQMEQEVLATVKQAEYLASRGFRLFVDDGNLKIEQKISDSEMQRLDQSDRNVSSELLRVDQEDLASIREHILNVYSTRDNNRLAASLAVEIADTRQAESKSRIQVVELQKSESVDVNTEKLSRRFFEYTESPESFSLFQKALLLKQMEEGSMRDSSIKSLMDSNDNLFQALVKSEKKLMRHIEAASEAELSAKKTAALSREISKVGYNKYLDPVAEKALEVAVISKEFVESSPEIFKSDFKSAHEDLFLQLYDLAVVEGMDVSKVRDTLFTMEGDGLTHLERLWNVTSSRTEAGIENFLPSDMAESNAATRELLSELELGGRYHKIDVETDSLANYLKSLKEVHLKREVEQASDLRELMEGEGKFFDFLNEGSLQSNGDLSKILPSEKFKTLEESGKVEVRSFSYKELAYLQKEQKIVWHEPEIRRHSMKNVELPLNLEQLAKEPPVFVRTEDGKYQLIKGNKRLYKVIFDNPDQSSFPAVVYDSNDVYEQVYGFRTIETGTYEPELVEGTRNGSKRMSEI